MKDIARIEFSLDRGQPNILRRAVRGANPVVLELAHRVDIGADPGRVWAQRLPEGLCPGPLGGEHFGSGADADDEDCELWGAPPAERGVVLASLAVCLIKKKKQQL